MDETPMGTPPMGDDSKPAEEGGAPAAPAMDDKPADDGMGGAPAAGDDKPAEGGDAAGGDKPAAW